METDLLCTLMSTIFQMCFLWSTSMYTVGDFKDKDNFHSRLEFSTVVAYVMLGYVALSTTLVMVNDSGSMSSSQGAQRRSELKQIRTLINGWGWVRIISVTTADFRTSKWCSPKWVSPPVEMPFCVVNWTPTMVTRVRAMLQLSTLGDVPGT